MSQTPISNSSPSPLKRPGSTDGQLQNDSKRPKLEDSSLNLDDIEPSTSGITLPRTDKTDFSSPNNNFDISSQLHLPTPSQPTSNISTPSQVQLELPTLQPDSGLQLPPTVDSSAQQSANPTPPPPQQPQLQQPPVTLSAPPMTTENNNSISSNINNTNNNAEDPEKELTKSKTPADPEKLSDALLSAGVDLKAEEALLTSTVNNLPNKPGPLPNDQTLNYPIILSSPFLDPRQLTAFMNKVIRNNGLKQHVDTDSSILELVTNSCEEWLKDILTTAIITSRHRRRSIKNTKRSDISRALRDISVQQKTLEDQRAEKKKNFGLVNDDKDKEGTEEIQHKATNATVAMMTGKKKKYSWMTGGGAGAGSSRNASSGSGVGEQGIRYREAREEPGVSVRDLLNSLEKKRMGVDSTIVKGYAKLKD